MIIAENYEENQSSSSSTREFGRHLLPFEKETPGVVARSAAVDIDAKLM